MKLNLISKIKNNIYELTHELSNDYRLPISIIKENLAKSQNWFGHNLMFSSEICSWDY